MVKFATSLLIATAIAAPAFAIVNDNLETRELSGPSEEDLYSRDPLFFGALFRGAKAIGKVASHAHHHNNNNNNDHRRGLTDEEEIFARFIDDEFTEREVQELEEREPLFFGALFRGAKAIAKVAKHAHHGSNNNNNNNHKRELADDEDEVFARFVDEEFSERDIDVPELAAREPLFFGALFRGAKAIAKVAKHAHHGHSNNNNNNHKRDLSEDEEIFARFIDDEFSAREVQELEEREPLFFGALFRGAKAIAKVAKHAHHGSNNNNNNHKRELVDDEEEIFARFADEELTERDIDVEELAAREPLFFGALFRGAKAIGKVAHHAHHNNNNNNNNKREISDDDMFEREVALD